MGIEFSKGSESYQKIAASCEMNPDDMAELGVKPGDAVKIRSKFGEFVGRAVRAREELPRGMIYVPYGKWANMLTPPDTRGTGMPQLKGIEVEVEPA